MEFEEKNKSAKYLTVGIGDEIYGIPVEEVREALITPKITRIPGIPEYGKGIIDVRDKAALLIDLGMKLGLGAIDARNETNVLVLDLPGEKTLGAQVQKVHEVIEILTESVEPPPQFGNKIDHSYIRGIGKAADGSFIILLNVKAIFEEFIQEEKKTLSA